ncbi:MAG: flagellar synthesis regulator FleN, partial [Desulfobacterales bacterium]|nr:flagellar synthesis regulator FleN [Desulfobacterales bacterium]
YALMKVMSQEYGTRHFRLVVNMVDSESDGKRVYASLSNALTKFLKNVVLEYAGCIPFDRQLQRAVQKRSLLLDHDPDTHAGNAIKELADYLMNSKVQFHSGGKLTFFMNRMLGAGS